MNSWLAHHSKCGKAGDSTVEVDDSFLPTYRPRQISKPPRLNVKLQNVKSRNIKNTSPDSYIKVTFSLKQTSQLLPV